MHMEPGSNWPLPKAHPEHCSQFTLSQPRSKFLLLPLVSPLSLIQGRVKPRGATCEFLSHRRAQPRTRVRTTQREHIQPPRGEGTLHIAAGARSGWPRHTRVCTTLHWCTRNLHERAPNPFAKSLQAHIPTWARTMLYGCAWPHTGMYNPKWTHTAPNGHAQPQMGTHSPKWTRTAPDGYTCSLLACITPNEHAQPCMGAHPRWGHRTRGGHTDPWRATPSQTGSPPARPCRAPRAGGSCATRAAAPACGDL